MSGQLPKSERLQQFFSDEARAQVLNEAKLKPEEVAGFLNLFGSGGGGEVRRRTDENDLLYHYLREQFGGRLVDIVTAMRDSEQVRRLMAQATLEIGHAGLSRDSIRLRSRMDELGVDGMAVAIQHMLQQMLNHMPRD